MVPTASVRWDLLDNCAFLAAAHPLLKRRKQGRRERGGEVGPDASRPTILSERDNEALGVQNKREWVVQRVDQGNPINNRDRAHRWWE